MMKLPAAVADRLPVKLANIEPSDSPALILYKNEVRQSLQPLKYWRQAVGDIWEAGITSRLLESIADLRRIKRVESWFADSPTLTRMNNSSSGQLLVAASIGKRKRLGYTFRVQLISAIVSLPVVVGLLVVAIGRNFNETLASYTFPSLAATYFLLLPFIYYRYRPDYEARALWHLTLACHTYETVAMDYAGRADILEDFRKAAKAIEKIPSNYLDAGDEVNLRLLSRMSYRRAALIRSYGVWVLAPTALTRVDLMSRLESAIDSLVHQHWFDLPELDIEVSERRNTVLNVLLYVLIIVLVGGFFAVAYFSNKLGPVATSGGYILGVIIAGLLTRTGINIGAIGQASLVSSAASSSVHVKP